MLIDMRSYTCKPGMLQKHIELYKEFGKAPQSRALGQPVAWMTTETGNVNEFVHLWAYKDAADRAEKRAAMESDPEWQDYKRRSAELGALVHQENRLMQQCDFFPLLTKSAE